MARLILPSPLAKFTNDQKSFDIQAGTVKEGLLKLVSQHDALKHHLLDEQENIRPFIRIYVGEDDISGMQKENTPVSDHETISIIPAIAGGC